MTSMSTLKALGRALGKARDTDEALRLARGDRADARRRPRPAAAVLRARLLPEQLRQRRRLIKTLEAARSRGARAAPRRASSREARDVRRTLGGGRGIAAGLRGGRCVRRPDVVETAIEHASGVYFPNRAHKVRVAMKKLRYAIELLDSNGGRPASRRCASLRRAQEALGQVHDREVLRQRLTSLAEDEDIPAARELARCARSGVPRDLRNLSRRCAPALLAACAELTAWSRQARRARRVPALLLVGAVALPSAASCWSVARDGPADERPRRRGPSDLPDQLVANAPPVAARRLGVESAAGVRRSRRCAGRAPRSPLSSTTV